MPSNSYYACLECKDKFHKECVESPLEIKHPSHPFHSLRLYSPSMNSMWFTCCGTYIDHMFYYCATCQLSMHAICAMRPIPFVVDHPKSHPHPLTFFPTQASTVCHICAMIKELDPTYICIQCVFVIHKNCIGFPHAIRISRHPHRISFTSSLPSSRNLSCGVCRKQVDNNYGAYACKTCDAYFVHSKCALNPNVWDGKELEGVPEKDDEIDDGEPLKRIADGIILHPFHSHHLRFEISEEAYDANKYCRGCALPVYEGGFYSCVECNFILHENCANASRMKRYPLYPHPLTLKVATKGVGTDEGIFQCNQCAREGTGYFYEHHIDGRNFKLDLRCALITEPFDFQGHKHPLFLASEPYELTLCHMCKEESDDSKLICIECDYILCYRCATFPYKARYKHDNHILIICDREKGSGQQDWCEICEGNIEEGEMLFFYKCHDCCIALHVECLLGADIYMKPGDTIKDSVSVVVKTSKLTRPKWIEFWILLNSSVSRPICIGYALHYSIFRIMLYIECSVYTL